MKVIQNTYSSSWIVQLDSVYFEDGDFMTLKDGLSIGLGGAFLCV